MKAAIRTGLLAALLLGAGSFFPRSALGLEQDDGNFKLRSDTRLVEIEVSVRDSQGRTVEDLKQSDFVLTDNGKVQPFSIFSFQRNRSADAPPESPTRPPERPTETATRPGKIFTNAGASSRPLEGHSTIIVLDGMNGWFDNFVLARQGVLGLLAAVPADENIAVYVLVKGLGLVVAQDYTRDRARLAEAVANFIPRGMPPAPPHMPEGAEGMQEDPPPIRGSEGEGGPPVEAWHISKVEKAYALRIAAEDVRLSLSGLAEKLRSLPGRKTVFWVSQGFPPAQIHDGSGTEWNRTLALLNDANIEVNTVDSNGLGGPPRYWGKGGILTMLEVAKRTGGQAYFYTNDLAAAMASKINDSRSSYTLGFYATKMDGAYHQLKVQVNRPGLQLHYRQGYFADQKDVRDRSAVRSSTLQSALLNPAGMAEVGISATFDIAPGNAGSTLKMQLTLSPESLSIKPAGDGYAGNVETLFVARAAGGRELGKLGYTKKLTIGAAYKARFDKWGMTLSQSVPLVKGTVEVLVVVRDTASGRMGTIVIPLE